MENITIEVYRHERDSAAIRIMLRGEEYVGGTFLENESNFHNGIFVGRYNGVTVAFLTLVLREVH